VLDLAKLARQMPDMGQEMQKEALKSAQRLEKALQLLAIVEKEQDSFINAQEEWCDRLLFTAATPQESMTKKVKIPFAPYNHSVFSADGSQIAPSHHEIAYCYLINIGRIMLHYGQNLHPLLDTLPEIYYKNEDLYVSRKWGIRTEEWMSYRRTVAEAEVLSEMACTWVNPPGAHFHTPNLAMMDGSLIYWFLETLPIEAREEILNPILQAWENLRETKIPLVGYISASRSTSAINFLRFPACPYDSPNCMAFCGEEVDKTPCQKVEPLKDASLWSHLLQHRDLPKINENIRFPQVRLIGMEGEQLGIFDTRDANRLAEEKELDLVLVSETADPPVCRIMDYGKFKFEQEKKARAIRKKQHTADVKEVKMRYKIDEHDYQVRLNQAKRFLNGGDKVKATINFRGREAQHTHLGQELLERLAQDLGEMAEVQQRPKKEGRNMIMLLSPKKV